MPHLEIRTDERMVIKLRPSWLNFLQHFAISFLIIVLFGRAGQIEAGLGLTALILSIPPLTRYNRLYTVTTCRVVERKGILSRHTAEADLEEIVLVNVHQGVWERLLNLGEIDMMSASDGGPDVVFCGISDPFRVKEVISGLKAQRKQR